MTMKKSSKLFPQLAFVNMMIKCHWGVARIHPRLDTGSKRGPRVVKFVPFYFWSASKSAPFRRPPGARVDTINFIFYTFSFTFIPRWWYVFTPGHLADKWSWSEPRTEWEQVENTFKRWNWSPEKLKKKCMCVGGGGALVFGVYIYIFLKQTHYNI